MTPFSDEWTERAGELLLGLSAPEGARLDGRVQFRIGDTARWGLEIRDGVLTGVGTRVDGPDVEIEHGHDVASAILDGAIDGTEAMRRSRMLTASGAEPLPPNDLGTRIELSEMPTIARATMTVQYEFARGPFGDVSHWTEFGGGKVTAMDFGRRPDAEVTVMVPYHAMARVRCGDITILDALECGSVDGAIGPLAMLAGIHESPEFHDAELAGGRRPIALAALGELAATAAFQAAWRALAGESSSDG